MILGIDIGGSHISSALVDVASKIIVEGTFIKTPQNSAAKGGSIIENWIDTMNSSLLRNSTGADISGIAVAMPGPFLYEEGVSLMNGNNKYEHLYSINIRKALESGLLKCRNVPVIFENDAACFALAESISDKAATYQKVIAVTLGTGLGSAFVKDKEVVKESEEAPYAGTLYKMPFKEGIAEDYISSQWIENTYRSLTGEKLEVKEIARLAKAHHCGHAIKVFECLGRNLAEVLQPNIKMFKADCIIIGGNIALAHDLFLPYLQAVLQEHKLNVPVIIAAHTEVSAIKGATLFLEKQSIKKEPATSCWRKSLQPILPPTITSGRSEQTKYSLYPSIVIESGQIFDGYTSLAKWIAKHRQVIIDGFIGNDWPLIMEKLHEAFRKESLNELWFEMSAFEKPGLEIEEMVKPFLGKDESPWGKRTTLSLEDFYQLDKLMQVEPSEKHDVSIIAGTGAALCNWDAPVIYIDLPKNELQYRMRAGTVTNLGKKQPDASELMYKRFYFVDWVVLNKHRQRIKNNIHLVADGQWKEYIAWAPLGAVRKGLAEAARNVFRPRPWFEAGAWGGQWLKQHISGLPKEEINYAWSFELISPENGIILESGGKMLELSFDWLMEHEAEAVLGKDATRFGTAFPIRFDFLDTMGGGNLSIQCHPRLSYIQEHFGEDITQDETYYILECEENAEVYLGFQDNIKPRQFREALEKSVNAKVPVDIEKFVNKRPSRKHDFFLIPNGTVHSSGKGNLVLEISATPYIFTFKMYDWLRLDLNNRPRPINIDHAFHNLDFERKGAQIDRELISKPSVIETGDNYRIIHLPTHAQHFYDVHRIEFTKQVTVETNDKCHVMMVVEGTSVLIKTRNGITKRFNYAETFIVPAAAGTYELINEHSQPVKVIKAFIK